MKHRITPRFRQCYDALPEEVRRIADRSYELLTRDPRHPSLHFKKTGRLWSVRAGLYHRALAVDQESDMVWFWIGTHSEYDKLLARR